VGQLKLYDIRVYAMLRFSMLVFYVRFRMVMDRLLVEEQELVIIMDGWEEEVLVV
jgi:hypothetical protein